MKKLNGYWKLFTLLFCGFLSTTSAAAEDVTKRLSPPEITTGTVDGAKITIHYGSPSVKARKIWGELVPYNKVWRAGANEATTFETDKDLIVEDKPLPAGRYSFFTIPTEKTWTIIFNKTADQWGAFQYDLSKDQLRVEVKAVKSSVLKEKMGFDVTKKGFKLIWENLEVPVSVKAAK